MEFTQLRVTQSFAANLALFKQCVLGWRPTRFPRGWAHSPAQSFSLLLLVQNSEACGNLELLLEVDLLSVH